METIREIMHKPVVTVDAGDSPRRARQLMDSHGIGHLPVLSEGHLVGVVSRQELTGGEQRERVVPPVGENLAVERIMTQPVDTLQSSASIAWAAALVRTLGIGCIPVVDDRRLIGIVTRRDLRSVEEEAAPYPLDGEKD